MRLRFDEGEALTIDQAVAGRNAHAKGVRLGIYTPESESVEAVPVVQTDQGSAP